MNQQTTSLEPFPEEPAMDLTLSQSRGRRIHLLIAFATPTSPTTPAPVSTPLPTPSPTNQPTPAPQDVDCTEVCCFDSHNTCLAAVDVACKDRRRLGPDHCANECDELEEEGEIHWRQWDACYLQCRDDSFGESDCFDEEELKCIPCEEEVECESECDILLEEDEIDDDEWEDCVNECD